MSLLVTQSLLSAWQWMFKAEDADAAETDFMRVLRRERGEPSPAMLAGRVFESLCYAIADGRFIPLLDEHGTPVFPTEYLGASKVAEIIHGGAWQVKERKEISVGNRDFLLYGILDVLKAGTIYDIKFRTKSLGSGDVAGKYLDSPQHPMYLDLVPEATQFAYLVSDGRDLYVESYQRGDVAPIEDTISEFMAYLERTGLTPLYIERWASK